MPMILSYSGRFQWWSYTASHAQLLLRRTKTPERPTQVDVLFKDVELVNLPTTVDDLEVEEVSQEHDTTPKTRGVKVFGVRGRGVQGQVIAGAVVHEEADRNYYEDSRLLPPFPPRNP